jgi:hypothetical protein
MLQHLKLHVGRLDWVQLLTCLGAQEIPEKRIYFSTALTHADTLHYLMDTASNWQWASNPKQVNNCHIV